MVRTTNQYSPSRGARNVNRCCRGSSRLSIRQLAPASSETFHLIDAKALAAMRPGTVLVNVARGSLVDEAALVEALETGQLAAAALDVFATEPLPPDSPFWDLPTVYLSAHSSVSIDRYLDDVFDLFADNVTRYVAGEPLRNLVDMKTLGFG